MKYAAIPPTKSILRPYRGFSVSFHLSASADSLKQRRFQNQTTQFHFKISQQDGSTPSEWQFLYKSK